MKFHIKKEKIKKNSKNYEFFINRVLTKDFYFVIMKVKIKRKT